MSFASFRLDTLNLAPDQLAACTRANLSTASDVLLLAPADLSRKLRNAGSNLSAPDLVRSVSRAIVPKSQPLSTRADALVIRTGDTHVDALLGGGIRAGCITELVGESAAGKSHMTLLLALAVQQPALCDSPGGAIVINSERVLETQRLVQLAGVVRERHHGGPPTRELLDNIHTSRVADVDALEHALQFVVPHMLAERKSSSGSALLGEVIVEGSTTPAPARGLKPIRLLILDSLAALFRGDTERSRNGLVERSKHVAFISDRLKAMAVEYGVAVVVVNQVKDVFGWSGGPGSSGSQSSQPALTNTLPPAPTMLWATQARHFAQMAGHNKEAALGIPWANAVNTRLMLARTGRRRMVTLQDMVRAPKRPRAGAAASNDDPDAPFVPPPGLEVDESKATLIRRMCLVFSPFAPPGTLDYVLTGSGLHALPGSFRAVDLGPALRRRDARLRTAWASREEERAGHRREPQSTPLPATQVDDTDVFDDLGDLPPEFWEGLDALDEEPMAVGVVD
ncbi:uncharacterized protein EHS24_001960 [Apiotrichum porosum]|uniref:RecA family profile 1 domain-containing protein n=1 Tax=Apiotrichum porosum TaxID=105984 RepID=A0A427XJQ9_9TREE|nr:uncharacterized protein EHS24_001960 [Apiotrichum porosum]RSH79032.1 hypothetical protein EHS24_001960 [Apiotrichum porosum]